MRLSVLIIALITFAVVPVSAVVLSGGQDVLDGDRYPYTQSIVGPDGTSFEVRMDGYNSTDSSEKYYVSTFTGLGIQKSASGAGNGDYRQINADEVLEMTIMNITGTSVSFTQLNGTASYFSADRELYLYKNDVLVRTIACDGRSSGSYEIVPPIVAVEGDSISFNPNNNVRLENFEVEIGKYAPYIPDESSSTSLLDTEITEEGHYFLTADWSALANLPNGVVVKVFNGDNGARLYFLGAKGPSTEGVDFDLLILEPGDRVEVLAGLTGDAGEDPELWTLSLDRYDSWSGSRYEVEEVPLGLASPLSGLDIHQNRWPKHSGFRNDFRGNQGSFNNFVAEALGHSPKVFGEEITTSPGNLIPMQSYAANNPDWQAMTHWNGKMLKLHYSPDDLPEKLNEFRPYHFRYNVGTYLSASIGGADSVITVDDPSLFVTNENNISIIIPVDPTTGERQFDAAEIVTVTAISGNQLTVTRNKYQTLFGYTSAGDFAAGSYIAPASQRFVMVENGGVRYNHSLLCPKDPDGRNGADMLVEMLANEFKAGKNLERFHGIMFDVLPRGPFPGEDLNLDGVADGGLDARGNELYHLGVQGFARKLRAALPDRILTFDGIENHWPALQTVFNGVEGEGFTRYNDSYTALWSQGLNYWLFTKTWNQSNAFYSFCAPKQRDLSVDDFTVAEYGSEEAAIAAYELESDAIRLYHQAGLTILGVAFAHEAIEDSNGILHARDEVRNGVKGELQWLGAPISEIIRPGLEAPDVLNGAELPAAGWSSPDGSATISLSAEGLLVSPVDTGIDHEMTIEFSGINIPSGDLIIRLEGKGGLPHLPADTARFIEVELPGRAGTNLTDDTLSGVVNDAGFTEVTAFYRNAGGASGRSVTLRLTIESAQDITLRNFTFHNATDLLLREFENGVVVCNSSHAQRIFDLASYFPGQQFRRIQGQPYHDPITNDGSTVGSTLQLDGYRGLFLVKDVVEVVDFDRTGFGNADGRSPDFRDDFNADWNFSETEPLVTSDNGTNPTIYGGIANDWTVANGDFTVWVRHLQETFQNQLNPNNGSDTSAKGMLVWKKEDFLNGADAQIVSLADGGARLSFEASVLIGTREVHFVVKEGGTYYVSEDFTATSDELFSIDPTETDWAEISTSNYSIGNYATRTFSNVEAVGIYFSITNTENQSLIRMSDFNLVVPISAVTENQIPVFSVDPVVLVDATEGVAYSGSIAGSATDADNDTLSYSLVGGGADWLNVGGDGSLSGTPTLSDIGANTVTVQVIDGNGGSATADLEITVVEAPEAGPLEVDLKITPSGSGSGSGDMDISWVGESGTSYQLQGRADLATGTWENVGEAVIGDGSVITIPITTGEDAFFYRVVAQ